MSLCEDPGLPHTCRDRLSSASHVLRLQECATTPSFFLLFFLVFDSMRQGLLYSPGWPQTCYVAEAGLGLLFLPLPVKCWDDRCTPPCLESQPLLSAGEASRDWNHIKRMLPALGHISHTEHKEQQQQHCLLKEREDEPSQQRFTALFLTTQMLTRGSSDSSDQA